MKANELRIGNYVYDDVLKDIDTVYQLDLRCVNDCYIKDLNNEMKPIPLTEEWLLKFGIEKEEFEDYYTLSEKYWGIHISKSDNGKFDVHIRNEYMLCEIKHVHQLQNLYFALTGEELTIEK